LVCSSPKRCLGMERTPLERALLVLLLVMTSICAIMLIILAKPSPRSSRTHLSHNCLGEHCRSVCITEACVKAAATILRNMDRSVDPCSDFYNYACGHWKQHHVLPPDRPHSDTFAVMKDQLKVLLKGYHTQPSKTSSTSETLSTSSSSTSKTCEAVIIPRRHRGLLERPRAAGPWYILGSNLTPARFGLVAFVQSLLRDARGGAQVRGHTVLAQPTRSTVNVLRHKYTDTIFRRISVEEYEYSREARSPLSRYICIGTLPSPTSYSQRQCTYIYDYEASLPVLIRMISMSTNWTSALPKNTTSRFFGRSLTLGINWTLYFKTIMPMEIPPTEEIVLFAPTYIKQMSELLQTIPKRVIANYILWRFVSNRVGSLDKRFLDKQQEYFGAIYGTQTTAARWKTCTLMVNKNMGMAVGALFVRRHFNDQSKKKARGKHRNAEEMISDIKAAFLEILNDVDWMDSQTRHVARQKAELMTEKIGYPEYISDATELDKEYEVEFKRDTYFENIIKNLKHSALKMAMKLRTGVDRTEWITYPAVVNAFYTRSKNFISFPAGVLQPPLYHRNYPRSVNYGGIGVVIGHEITHGFDDKGRQFDQHGNLKQWWKPEALDLFHAKAQCMVNQYSKYVLPEVNMPVNGVNTQGENIADNGGVKQAFRAYKRREERSGPEPQLPGLNLTHDQLFFLTYAQIWCGTMRPEHAINTIRTGAHSPGRFRVIGVLSNSADFARAYNCPRGSPMNPQHKCVVW
ncbi:unnamed protein product, partial [Ixodes hexagonus]